MKKFKQVQTISDKSLEPFFITKDEYSYTVKEMVTSDANHFRSKGKSKTYEKMAQNETRRAMFASSAKSGLTGNYFIVG